MSKKWYDWLLEYRIDLIEHNLSRKKRPEFFLSLFVNNCQIYFLADLNSNYRLANNNIFFSSGADVISISWTDAIKKI